MKDPYVIMDFKFSADKTCQTHFHQDIEIIYVLEGKMELQVETEKYKLSRGNMILINSNRRHSVCELAKDLFWASFQINYGMLTEMIHMDRILFWCNSSYDNNSSYTQLNVILDNILNKYFEKENEGILKLNSYYYEAVYFLITHFLITSEDRRIKNQVNSENDRIFAVQTYVDENYNRQIRLSDLAKQLYLSNAYLSKYVKKQFGISFKDYVNKIRLFHALDDLVHSEKRITQIAMDHGFPTSAAFNKAFRVAYEVTPSAYRAKMHEGDKKDENSESEEQKIQKRIESYLENKIIEAEDIQTDEVKRFEVDLQNAVDYHKNWCQIMNIGSMEVILNSTVQEQVLMLKQETGFGYARIWNVFTADMYDKGQYNFSRIERALDFLVKNKIKPYIELSFKPIHVTYSINAPMAEKANEIIFQDNASYQLVMQEFARHLLNRYGPDELQNWYFELWKDERLNMQDEDGWYFECFEIGYRALKGVENGIKVGGAGFAMGYDRYRYRELLKNWKSRSIQPDFISAYAYSYELIRQNNMYYDKRSLDQSFLKNQVDIFKKVLEDEGYGEKELHISEWNYTISNRNCISDSPAQAAFVLKTCIESIGNVSMMGYWHASDICTEYYDSEGILYGDSGLMTQDSIKKPSYYAFHFLNFTQSKLLGKTENALLTTNGKGNYTIVCHNSKPLTYRYNLIEEQEITIEDMGKLYEDHKDIELQFSIKNVENGNYLVRLFYINEENGSVQDTWKDMEYIRQLSSEEVYYLRQSAMPKVELHKRNVINGILDITTRLKAHEIRLIDIRYQY